MSILDRLLADEEPKDTELAGFFDNNWSIGRYIHRRHGKANIILKLKHSYEPTIWDAEVIALVDEQSAGYIDQIFVLDETLSYNKLMPISDTVLQMNIDEEEWLYFYLRGELYIVDYAGQDPYLSEYKTMLEAKEFWNTYKECFIPPPTWLLKKIVETM